MIASSPPADNAVTTEPSTVPIPELRDRDFADFVLKLSEHTTECQLDDDLVAKANALGISTPSNADKRITSSVESTSTVFNARTFSMLSGGSASTALTNHSSLFGPPASDLGIPGVRDSKDLSFTQYDRYLSIIDPHHSHKSPKEPTPVDIATESVFSGKTKRSLFSVTSGLKSRMRWRRKSPQPLEVIMTCEICHLDVKGALHQVPCGHTYCADCLNSIIQQSVKDESIMPPRCCTQAIPGAVVKNVLDRDGQQDFLKAVIQYSTPWQARIFCSNSTCGEFIPPHHKVEPKHPLNVTCRKCCTRVCVMCKRNAHPTGKDCPEDWELHQALKSGSGHGWRRCYKCRNLVESKQGSTQMTCRCTAQFCYVCVGIWDPVLGCPNHCDGEEELERRRTDEATQLAEYEAERAAQELAADTAAAERIAAEERTQNHDRFTKLKDDQEQEMQRFQEFNAQCRIKMHARHEAQKQDNMEKQAEQEEKMKDRHVKTVGHLEDRQVAAEMDLRATLDQSERSVRIRLKHMEAYCDGLGRSQAATPTAVLPARVVTERDLRELGQQYNLRDGMERLHEAKINVMRDRQAKRMEELIERQETELEKLTERGQLEADDFAALCSKQEQALVRGFANRKMNLMRRWELAIEILRSELEAENNLKFAPIPTPTWPEENDADPNVIPPATITVEEV